MRYTARPCLVVYTVRTFALAFCRRKRHLLSSQPVLKTHYGSVKPYTRHTSACPHRNADDHNACACPKWLYIRRHGEKSKRVTLNTPSWEEAQRIASAKLRAMDPDIAAAQAVAEKHKRKLVTVSDGCKLFLQKVERDKGRKGEIGRAHV